MDIFRKEHRHWQMSCTMQGMNQSNIGNGTYICCETLGKSGLYSTDCLYPEDIKEIDSEEWIRLIQKIIEQSIYEIVILDMDEGVRDIYRVLRICNEIHMLTIDEPVAEAKVAAVRGRTGTSGLRGCQT